MSVDSLCTVYIGRVIGDLVIVLATYMNREDSGPSLTADTHPTICKMVQVIFRTWGLVERMLHSDQLYYRILTVSSALNKSLSFN